jgi:hypothetical protein
MRNFKTGLLILSFTIACVQLKAQPMFQASKGVPVVYQTIGIQAGIMNYFGDLNPLAQYVSTDISATRPGLGITYSRRMGSRATARFGLMWGRLTGSDFEAADPTDERHRYRYGRNASFRNDVYEFSAMIEYDLIPSLGRNKYYAPSNRAAFSPYLLLGFAGFYHNPRAQTPLDWAGPEGAGQWVNLRPLRTEGQGLTRDAPANYEFAGEQGSAYEKQYSKFQFAIPFGVGVRFKVTPRMHLAFETVFRYTFTDYIDDVGGNYANSLDLESDLARIMANRTLEASDVSGNGVRDLEVVPNAIVLDDNGRPTISGYGRDGDQRGESGSNDVFMFTGVHLTYIFGRDADVICSESKRRTFGKRPRNAFKRK